MKVYRRLEEIQLPGSACAIGMFDGIHVGHQLVLENALREARLLNVQSVVFSFANHPQFLISQTPTQLLSSLEERLAACEAMGFDVALIPEFDTTLMSMSAHDFVQDILLNRLSIQSVTVGYDHRFGKSRQGDGAYLTSCGQQFGFDTQIIDPVRVGDQIVSSTLIRKLLSYGDLDRANQLLGKPYHLTGIVEKGLQRGRQLGFPTANITLDAHRLVPAIGTYGGSATLAGEIYPAVCNIGLCPTFGDQSAKRVEVHLLGYDGPEFYGETFTFQFRQKLRDERKFPSVEELVAQIRRDCAATESAWIESKWKPEDLESSPVVKGQYSSQR